MTIDEMIAVLEAHKRGEKIEIYISEGSWNQIEKPSFNFGENTYRIAKPAPKKRKAECWRMSGGDFCWYQEGSDVSGVRIPSLDMEYEE